MTSLSPHSDHVRSELAREKMWSRIHLVPMLQAEEDRDLVRRHWADQAREKELLGSQTAVYHSDRYVWIEGVPLLCVSELTEGQIRETDVFGDAWECHSMSSLVPHESISAGHCPTRSLGN